MRLKLWPLDGIEQEEPIFWDDRTVDDKKRYLKSERAGPHPIGQKGQLVKRSLGPKS